VEEYQHRRDRLVELVGQTPHLTGYRPDGAFYLFPSLPEGVDGANVALKLLRETGVCTIPGDTFGEAGKHALRISYSTSLDQIEEAFERIIPWMKKQNFG
jgi:aminotransferase